MAAGIFITTSVATLALIALYQAMFKFCKRILVIESDCSKTDKKSCHSGKTNERKVQRWLSSFRRLDPRYQILTFFTDVAREGAKNIEDKNTRIMRRENSAHILVGFHKAATFSVWRPTSKDAIKMMMTGECTGKGLDVKGKSAKKGILSGFIPFVQVHEEKDKKEIRRPPKDAMMRIFYKSEEAREKAVTELTSISEEMVANFLDAKGEVNKYAANQDLPDEACLENLIFEVDDPKIYRLDDYSPSVFGIMVAERIVLEAYIFRQDISRCDPYETGRPSEPSFQDMNFACVRKYKGSGPRAVVLQTSETAGTALRPQSLVVAYEENGHVAPVASDFDCFLVGTRNVTFRSFLSDEQVKMLKWLLTQIETVLESPISSESWTSRWLEVLKRSADNGFCPQMPEYGFGDPKSYAIMEDVVSRLSNCGAVRHGAECFNYFFPQELDDHFLLISDHLEGNVPWKYVNVTELQDILCEMVDQGFTFPLNPKWILADQGWKRVYDKMMSSHDGSILQSLDVWYPVKDGIHERIEDIHRRFPDGFQRSKLENDEETEKAAGTEAMDLAEQQLRRHIILKRAKLKLKIALSMRKNRISK